MHMIFKLEPCFW